MDTQDRIERAATIDDAVAATEMFNARSRHFYGKDQATEEQIRAWMGMPRFDLARDSRVITDKAGNLLAWAHVMDPGPPHVQIGCGLSVVLTHMQEGELWDALIAWSEQRARDYIPLAPPEARVALWLDGLVEDVDRLQAIERTGAQRVRIGNRMRIDLEERPEPPEWPDGIRVRTYVHDVDLRPLVEAFLETFRDHWGFVESPLDEVVAQWQEGIEADRDRFDPSLWFLAVDGDEIAGFALCSDDIAGDKTRSELDPFGVRKAWRRRGIGLALLRHSFLTLFERGKKAVELDMDSENLTGALHLYERAGMRAIRQQAVYEKELRPGTDLALRELGD
jgi:ribosomal protein S18 acetylase RimI-like enzyme